MPEAWPATWAPPCAGMHGPKFVPVGPYEPLHHAPTGAWAKAIAGMTDATATNATTIPIRLMSTLRLFAFTAPTAPIRIAGSEHVRSNVGARLRSFWRTSWRCELRAWDDRGSPGDGEGN